MDPGATRLGEPDGDGLFGGARTMLSLADMVHFFTDKFSCLGGGSFSFLLVLSFKISLKFFITVFDRLIFSLLFLR